MDTFDKMYDENPDYFNALPASELKEIQNDAMMYDINNFGIKTVFFVLCSILLAVIGYKLITFEAYTSLIIISYTLSAFSVLLARYNNNKRKAKLYSYNFFQELFEANNI